MTPRRPRVVIAGGGVAGLEGLLVLRAHLGGTAQIELIDPGTEFAYRPLGVAAPFGRAEVERFELDRVAADHGARHRRDAVSCVDVPGRRLHTARGEDLEYDALLVAVGARAAPGPPGALTFASRPEDVRDFSRLLEDLEARRARSVVFAVPQGLAWPLPLYELALLTADRVAHAGTPGVELVLVTPERAPLAVFGEEAARRVADRLCGRGVRVLAEAAAAAIEDGEVVLAGGGRVPADRVVTLPRLTGPWIGGLPHDDEGFLPVDPYGAVPGEPAVWGAGDGTTFPIKQGGIAAQQADVAAASIAAALGAPVEPAPFRPVLRGLLLDAGVPRFLRGPSERPEEAGARPNAGDVSFAPLWWPPAKIAARYLAPYLANPHGPEAARPPLADRAAVPSGDERVVEAEHEDLADLALTLADQNAKWGDHRMALRCLDAVQALLGALPEGYPERRREWEARVGSGPGHS